MLDLKKLKGEEIAELKKVIDKYSTYERLDIFIDLTLIKLGVSKQELNNRDFEVEEEKEEVLIIEQTPQAVLYCDSEKCEVVY